VEQVARAIVDVHLAHPRVERFEVLDSDRAVSASTILPDCSRFIARFRTYPKTPIMNYARLKTGDEKPDFKHSWHLPNHKIVLLGGFGIGSSHDCGSL
jgi:alpha-ketoglutarate-dependent taurine dioxygenase